MRALYAMKHIYIFLAVLLVSMPCRAEIAEWYKRDIVGHILRAYAVVLYRVDSVALHSQDDFRHLYRIDTTTLEVLKGEAPAGKCYFFQTEGEWEKPDEPGEVRLVILGQRYRSHCGQIEPLYGAPGTVEYQELFRAIIQDGV